MVHVQSWCLAPTFLLSSTKVARCLAPTFLLSSTKVANEYGTIGSNGSVEKCAAGLITHVCISMLYMGV